MDDFKFRAAIMDVRQQAKLIDWLAEGASPCQHDVEDLLEQISDLAEKLAAYAQDLMHTHQEETNHE